MAYTAAKGIDIDWCIDTEKGLPKPDYVYYLYFDEESFLSLMLNSSCLYFVQNNDNSELNFASKGIQSSIDIALVLFLLLLGIQRIFVDYYCYLTMKDSFQ